MKHRYYRSLLYCLLWVLILWLPRLGLGQCGSAPVGATRSNPINMGTVYPACGFSYSDATRSNAPANCYGNSYGEPSDDIFYKFTMAEAGTARISTCGPNTNTFVYLLDAQGSQIAASTSCNTIPQIERQLPAGVYYLVGEKQGTNSGLIYMNLNVPRTAPPPIGATFSNPVDAGAINCGAPYTNIINQGQANCYGNQYGEAADDAYYKFTLGQSTEVTIANCSPQGYPTRLYLLDANGGQIAANKGYGPACPSSASASLTTSLPAGTYYAVTESGISDAAWNITITISGRILGTPTLSIAPPSASIDAGDAVTLTASGACSYSWSPATGLNRTTGPSVMASPAATTTYTVVGTSATGQLSAPATVTVTVSQNKNYIITNTVLEGGKTTVADLASLSVDQRQQQIVYFDGLGRAEQEVSTQATPGKKDLVVPIAYDPLGRVDTKYLPYAGGSPGLGNNGLFQADALTQQAAFYRATGDQVANDNVPSAKKVYEASPLSRVVEQGSSGSTWQPGNGRTLKFSQRTNAADEVRHFDDPLRAGLRFDGVDDYVQIGDHPLLRGGTTLTMEAWINPAGPQFGMILNKENAYEIARTADGFIWWAFWNTTTWEWINTGVRVPENTWSHIAITYEVGNVKTYLNGTLMHTRSFGSGAITPTSTSFRIGTRELGGSFFWGAIDEVRIWNTARSAADITAGVYTPAAPGPTLIASWTMSEGAGGSTINKAGNGLNGTLVNGTAWNTPPPFYAANELLVKETRDEHDALTTEYTDKQGKVVLKSVSNGGTVCAVKGYYDGGDLVLIAPAGMKITGIQSARFGTVKDASTSCASFTFGSCSADVTAQVRAAVAPQLSAGPTSVSVRINVDYLGDPCEGYVKSLLVVATYEPATPANELRTYYAYDAFDNLRLVIQPEGSQRIPATGTWAPDAAFLRDWCFQYRYDARQRLVEKQAPGAGSVQLVYNQRNQLVLTQDANQRAAQAYKWSFTKYDGLGRPVLTGLTTISKTQAQLQEQQDAQVGNFTEQRDNSAVGYTLNGAYPPVTDEELLSITYYDDYTAPALTGGQYGYTGPAADRAAAARGLVTGTRVRILAGTTAPSKLTAASNGLTTATYYDQEYRALQVVGDNAVGSLDRTTNTYDFAGRLRTTTLAHTGYGTLRPITNRFEYDHAGRLQQVFQTMDGQPEVLLAQHEYNQLGQLVDKKLHSLDNGATFLQSVDYRYNIRGWLMSINNRHVSNGEWIDDADPNQDGTDTQPDLFGMELKYHNPHGDFSTPQYNGNIAQAMWNSRHPTKGTHLRAYGYHYDAANRLKEARFRTFDQTTGWTWGIGPTDFSVNDIAYDANGNLQRLTRRGAVNGLNSSPNTGVLDQLTYSYEGNRLIAVDDAAPATAATHDFEDKNGQKYTPGGTAEYTYDANGNLTADRNKGITEIRYNHLNLPWYIAFDTGDRLEYTYSAAGTKLQKRKHQVNMPTVTTDYAGAFVYEQGQPVFAHTAEGRVLYRPGRTPYAWKYEYHLKDHLGNLRFAFRADDEGPDQTSQLTMEPVFAPQEEKEFGRVAESRMQDPGHARTGSYVARLNARTGRRLGPNTTVTIAAGDSVRAQVYGRYDHPAPLGRLLRTGALVTGATVAGSPGAVRTDKTLAQPARRRWLPYAGVSLALIPQLLHSKRAELPAAFLRYDLFNQDSQLVATRVALLQRTATDEWQPLEVGMKADSAGYVQVSLVNESGTPAYFDDLTVSTASGHHQENHYDPFGLNLVGIEETGSPNHRFQYNGKEKQEEFGLNWQDYGARMYDAQLGRWHVMDPLADKYLPLSPFSYVANNPLIYIDPDGKEIKIAGDAAFRNQTLIQLQKLTNDKLSLRKDGTIIITSLGSTNKNKDLNYGTNLIRSINDKGEGAKVVTITKTDKGNTTDPTDRLAAVDGNGSGSKIEFNPTKTSGGVDINGSTERTTFNWVRARNNSRWS